MGTVVRHPGKGAASAIREALSLAAQTADIQLESDDMMVRQDGRGLRLGIRVKFPTPCYVTKVQKGSYPGGFRLVVKLMRWTMGGWKPRPKWAVGVPAPQHTAEHYETYVVADIDDITEKDQFCMMFPMLSLIPGAAGMVLPSPRFLFIEPPGEDAVCQSFASATEGSAKGESDSVTPDAPTRPVGTNEFPPRRRSTDDPFLASSFPQPEAN